MFMVGTRWESRYCCCLPQAKFWISSSGGKRGRLQCCGCETSLATLACIAVVPLNPNGTRMYSYPVETLRSSAIQSYISEWFSPDFHQHKFLPFLLLLLGTLVAIAFTKTRARPRDLLLLAATLWGALHSVRHIPIFVL